MSRFAMRAVVLLAVAVVLASTFATHAQAEPHCRLHRAWCKPYSEGYYIGLEFLEMTKEDKDNLRYFIEEM